MSGRALELKYNVGRRTVVKAIASAWPESRKQPPPRPSKLDPFKPVIDEILRADLDAPRKQRHTVKRIFDRLIDEHAMADVSYPAVRAYVAVRKRRICAEAGRGPAEVFVPQAHRPGMEAEVDFGEVTVLPAVPAIVARVVRAARAAARGVGARRGVTGGGVSASEDSRDIQASVIGHLWEQARCYPLRRRHHVVANLMRETQRAAQRDCGVDHSQAAADVVSIDDDEVHRPLVAVPEELDASEELLGLLSWAVEEQRVDEHSATILTTRYRRGPIGRDGVATDRQIGVLIGVSQPTITRHRQRAIEQLSAAAEKFPGRDLPWAG